MNQPCTAFIERLAQIWPPLASAYEDTLDYWKPEEPPITVAYADLGQKIVDDFDMFSLTVRTEIMSLIEEGMASADEDLGIAVATGLIEAMIGRAGRSSGRVEQVMSYLGPISKSHAEAWIGN